MVSQSPTSITVSMPAIIGLLTGGSTILSYNLQYKPSTSTNYTTLVGEAPDSLLLTYTKNGLTANVLYQFRYRVRNKYGWGTFSEAAAILAAQVPNQVSLPSISIVSDVYVRIDWTAPYNGGTPITAYNILIEDSDGDFITETQYCDGTSLIIVQQT